MISGSSSDEEDEADDGVNDREQHRCDQQSCGVIDLEIFD
jgi:hypothetical protein